jgi:hypothetical protein
LAARPRAEKQFLCGWRLGKPGTELTIIWRIPP